jgi:hypothetical protein
VVVLELGEIIDVAVDHDPEGIGLVVRRDVALGKCLGHGCRGDDVGRQSAGLGRKGMRSEESI